MDATPTSSSFTGFYSRFLLDASRASSQQEILQILARLLPELVPDCKRASVVFPMGDGEHLRIIALQEDKVVPLDAVLSIQHTVVGQAFATGQVRATPEIFPNTPWVDLQALYAAGLRSGICMPMIWEDEVFGSINLARNYSGSWGETRTILADVARVVVSQLHLYRRIQRTERSLADSQRLVGALQQITRAGQALTLVTDTPALRRRALRVAHILFPEAWGTLLMKAEITPDTLAARCLEEGALIHLIGLDPTDTVFPSGTTSVLALPLNSAGICWGVLLLGCSQPSAFEALDIEIARPLAATTAGAILALHSRTRLDEARARAEEMTHLKDVFLATMSHEIRTPLHAILGMSQLLSAEITDAHQRELMDTILSSGASLDTLIADVLDYSRLEIGALRLEPQPFELVALIEETFGMVKLQAEARRLPIRMCLAPGLPERFVCDPARLRQILLNLLSNALKFTEEGEVVVSVSLRDEGLRVAVADTGPGIEPDALSVVFEPFRQADISTTRRFGGTGLGLAICRQLCRAMGGDISVQSTLGEGTIFTFMVEGVPDSGQECSDEEMDALLPPLSILLVDDHAVNRLVALTQLQHLGYQPVAASSGSEARRRYTEGAFDLVLMDLHMPDEDGLMTTRSILSRPGPHAVFVALTADAEGSVRRNCLDGGFSELLTKPVGLSQLRDMLCCVTPRTADASARYTLLRSMA